MDARPSSLAFAPRLPVRASHAGLYLCPGQGRHEEFRLDTYELIFMRRGSLHMHEEGREFHIERGQTLLLWPHRRHGGIGSYAANTQFYWLHFSLAGLPRKNRAEIPVQISQVATPRRPVRLTELFHRYLHDFQGARFPGVAADLLACEILVEAGDVRLADSKGETLAGKARALIDAEFHQAITPGAVASSLGYSLEYLGEKFQAAFARTLGQYLRERRIEEARLLLRETTLRTKEIADRCGFSSEQYLSRVFREHEGIPPSAYRSLHSRITINIR